MKRFIFGLLLAICLFSVKNVYAGSFGISPIGIRNEALKPGFTYTYDFLLSKSDPGEELLVVFEPDMKEANSWLEFEPGKVFSFGIGETTKEVEITINVPHNAEYKEYPGFIRVKAGNNDGEDEGVSIVKGARIEMDLLAAELEVADYKVKEFRIPDIKEGDNLQVFYWVENLGNTDLMFSKVEVEVYKQNMESIAFFKQDDIESVVPGGGQELKSSFSNELIVGEYFGNVKLYIGEAIVGEENLSFKIEDSFDNSGINGQENDQKKAPGVINPQLVLLTIVVLAFIVAILFIMAGRGFIERRIILPVFVFVLIIITLVYLSVHLYGLGISGFFGFDKDENINDNGSSQEQASVKGLSRDANDLPVKPLPVEKGDIIIYNIYYYPDLNSEIVYEMGEGEKFQVIEEKSTWYRVLIRDEVDGWLPKLNIERL